METGDRIATCDLRHTIFPELHEFYVKKTLERFLKCERCPALPERVGPRILSIEMSLVMSLRYIFDDDRDDAPCLLRFGSLAMM